MRFDRRMNTALLAIPTLLLTCALGRAAEGQDRRRDWSAASPARQGAGLFGQMIVLGQEREADETLFYS
jgi:hypothetical protein